ncbi:MAG: alpha-mannosidase [Chloroflexi bacterium]|nr:alpha-mannosidase [Chloroflexota bacterium]
MLKHLEITRQRLQNFTSEDNLRGRVYPQRAPVTLTVYSAPDRIPYAEAVQGNYRPTQVGEQFGPIWSTHGFKVDIEIPQNWKGHEVHLLWDSSSEACVWEDGQPLQGLTGSSSSWAANALRSQYTLTRKASGGEKITLYIEIACNGLFGITGDTQPSHIGLLRQAEIAAFDCEAWELLWDFVTVADMAQALPANTPRGGQALRAANDMINVCDLEDRSTWEQARKIAAKFLSARNGDGQHNLSAVGHAHIDTAWLWPLAETQRKCVRTFASAVRYMEDYADYKFACSQAQQYEWIKTMHPGLWEKIKARVKEDRFVPAGGTWVEPDCNIPSGESLVRQFLFGQRFFRKEFGITCTEFWNPDVFGYSGALPQIMRRAGIKYFLTQKLSWNQLNKPTSTPVGTEGIDGSRVLTHFPPADTYNAMVTVKEALFNVSNFKDHERANESYLLFGFGDGGGGPTIDMLERLKRMKDVDGLPRMEQRTPAEFFKRCDEDIEEPLVWVGELYFELHRGTYTTQARNKLGNRRSELLLRDVEFLSALARATKGSAYPGDEINRLWKLVLLNQFHDIIPGSSITEVYNDSAVHYEEIRKSGEQLRNEAVASLSPTGQGSTGQILAINTLGNPRSEVVELPQGMAGPQAAANGAALAVVSAPAMGYSVAVPSGAASPVTVSEADKTITLENQYVLAAFNREGRLVSLFDKRANRQALAPNTKANHFVMFDDEPNNWEAWDVEVFHLEKRYEVGPAKSMRVIEGGPLRASIEVTYDLSANSTLKQIISLTATSPRLDFANEVEWHERHKFLKVEFPFDLRAQEATYEIQFGHLQRPTHFNTSWDIARFEVSAHRWADLSEPDFGVALLNDCKYGYATQGNVMRLSLLRSAKSPDPVADMGHHTFRYALLPHTGDFRAAGVIEEGYRFNVPLIVAATNAAPVETSFFGVSSPSVVIDTVKQAEDSNAIIARLYEAHGKRGTVRFTSTLPVKAVSRCNLLEEDDQKLAWADGGVDVEVTPFQIVTLKMEIRN